MKIDKQTTPQAVVAELDSRILKYRIDRGLTQAELAKEAGVSKGTVERIEKGCDTQLSTLFRLLRVLGLSDRLNQLIPETTLSPIDKLQGKTTQPKRAKRKKPNKTNEPWKWGDEK